MSLIFTQKFHNKLRKQITMDNISAITQEFRTLFDLFGHYNKDDIEKMTDEEVLRNAVRIFKEYNTVAVAAGATLIHTLRVYESMSNRGSYPAELLPTQPEYLGIQGYMHVKNCISALTPLVAHKLKTQKPDEK